MNGTEKLRQLFQAVGEKLERIPLIGKAMYYLKNWRTTGRTGKLVLVGTIVLAIVLAPLLYRLLVVGAVALVCLALCRGISTSSWQTPKVRKMVCILLVVAALAFSVEVLFSSSGKGSYAATGIGSGSGRVNLPTPCPFCNTKGTCSSCHGDGELDYRKGSVLGTYCEACEGEGLCRYCGGAGYVD